MQARFLKSQVRLDTDKLVECDGLSYLKASSREGGIARGITVTNWRYESCVLGPFKFARMKVNVGKVHRTELMLGTGHVMRA